VSVSGSALTKFENYHPSTPRLRIDPIVRAPALQAMIGAPRPRGKMALLFGPIFREDVAQRHCRPVTARPVSTALRVSWPPHPAHKSRPGTGYGPCTALLQLANILAVSDVQLELNYLRDQLEHLEFLRSTGPLDSDMQMLYELLAMRRAELLYAEYGADRSSRAP
jgi:hypothetical protein